MQKDKCILPYMYFFPFFTLRREVETIIILSNFVLYTIYIKEYHIFYCYKEFIYLSIFINNIYVILKLLNNIALLCLYVCFHNKIIRFLALNKNIR